jgi:sterol desaturase/sphingolipid hydroxylase (fatty acid hydroxylase superfamily)
MNELSTEFSINGLTFVGMAIRFAMLGLIFTIVQTLLALLPKQRPVGTSAWQMFTGILAGKHLINEQRIFRRGFVVDMLHFFVTRLIVNFGIAMTAAAALVWADNAPAMQPVRQFVGDLPVWLSAPVGLFIILCSDYWDHRTAHTWRWRWRFHAVHHVSKQLDWLASVRLHPVDQVIHRIVAYAPVLMLGFPILEVFGPLFAIMGFVAIFDHSNVRVEFPDWISRVIATPHYHHWHHAMKPIDKNFGAMSPLMDQIFGTYYVPKGKYPDEYGMPYDIEENWIDHMLTPFGYKGVWAKAWDRKREEAAHPTAVPAE